MGIRQKLSRICLWAAKILAGIAVLLIVVGSVAYLVFAPNFWEALRKIQNEWNPYNLPSFLARLALFFPAICFYFIHRVLSEPGKKNNA